MIYAVLIDGRGDTALLFRLIDVLEERPAVAEEEVSISFTNPTDEMQLVVELRNLLFPEPGDYRLQLLAGGELLCERTLTIIPLENPS